MGPTIRPFAYRDPWWDATGRVTRRRRRRRMLFWSTMLLAGASLGFVAGQARAATPSQTGTWSSVTSSVDRSTR